VNRAFLELLRNETDRLRDAGLYKREVVFTRSGGMAAGGMIDGGSGQPVINFTTHDYLGLAVDGQIRQSAIEALQTLGVGLSSQRVMCGTLELHKQLEDWLQEFLKVEDVMLFGSGYQANVGLFAPLFGRRDLVICDDGIHPSLADGVRLAGSRLATYRSNDPDDLEDVLRRSKWARFCAIVTNGVFPFSGRVADLAAVCDLAEKYDAIVIVDDCLGVGVLGRRGRGTAEFMDVMGRVDIITGTFSKAMGGAGGGFLAGRKEVVHWLRQKSPPYMFSAALSPSVAATALAAVQVLESGDAPLDGLRENITALSHGLLERRFRVLGGQHPLIAVDVGQFSVLQDFVNLLYRSGIYVHGLCYPVVPQGEARIRMMVSALHSRDHITRTLDAFEAIREQLGFDPSP